MLKPEETPGKACAGGCLVFLERKEQFPRELTTWSLQSYSEMEVTWTGAGLGNPVYRCPSSTGLLGAALGGSLLWSEWVAESLEAVIYPPPFFFTRPRS